jgi:hypothetical protein
MPEYRASIKSAIKTWPWYDRWWVWLVIWWVERRHGTVSGDMDNDYAD